MGVGCKSDGGMDTIKVGQVGGVELPFYVRATAKSVWQNISLQQISKFQKPFIPENLMDQRVAIFLWHALWLYTKNIILWMNSFSECRKRVIVWSLWFLSNFWKKVKMYSSKYLLKIWFSDNLIENLNSLHFKTFWILNPIRLNFLIKMNLKVGKIKNRWGI